MIESFIELKDITLYPSELNVGYKNLKSHNYGITGPSDGVQSLPVFSSPSECIISEKNWGDFNRAGIRPVLPRTLPIELRLEGCQVIFAAFSLMEVKEHFLGRGKRMSQGQFHVSIDEGNGHDSEILDVAIQLRRVYSNQINIMVGNIGNPKTYIDYCKAGIDYARVGFGSSSISNMQDKYGFGYPLGSLLLDITGLKSTSCVGLKNTQIIADGGISSCSDIMKAIALGADYVMLGDQLVSLLEAAGDIYQVKGGQKELLQDRSILTQTSNLKDLELRRRYIGNSDYELLAKRDGYNNVEEYINQNKRKHGDSMVLWSKVERTLEDWQKEFFDCSSFAFAMTGAVDWKGFKKNVKFGKL